MDAGCVLAAASLTYELFLGDSTKAEQVSNVSYFTRSAASSKYGWVATPCSTPAAAICEVQASAYPCPSPPSPPAEPDAPDLTTPTAPMLLETCGWRW